MYKTFCGEMRRNQEKIKKELGEMSTFEEQSQK